MTTGSATAREKAREAYRRRVREAFKAADQAFRGRYAAQLDELLGLSREELGAIMPGSADSEAYDKLIAVVREASRLNVEQAELVARVRALGEVGVQIARKVPSLAALL